MVKRVFATVAVTAALAVGASTTQVADAEEGCSVSDVDYAVVGNLLVRDTQFGAGNGTYPLGAGKVRLRLEHGANGAPGEAKLMSYELDNHLTVKASFALWSTKVVTDSRTTVASACDGAAKGTLQDNDVIWNTQVGGYHSDGTMSCEGNVCGKFGAPPPGSSPIHESDAVTFKPFHFSPDGRTFAMDYTKVSHTDSPAQTSFVSLSGREVKRTCVTQQATCQ